MKFKIIDRKFNLFDIQGLKYFDISEAKRETKTTTLERFNQLGGNVISSLFFGSKKFDIEIDIPTKTDLEYLNILNYISSFFVDKNKPFYLISEINNMERRKEIFPTSINPSHERGNLGRYTKLKIDFVDVNGLWESELYSLNGILSNNDIITINLPSDVHDSFFGIELENVGTLPIEEFYLEHIEESRNIFLKDLGFTNGSKFYIDGRNKGLITLNDTIRDVSLFSGNFFPLVKGANTIRYVGSENVSYNLDYRIRTEF